MHRGHRVTALALCLLAALAAAPAAAGVNAGFTASLATPERIENPAVGDVIRVPIDLQGTTEIKGVVVRMAYDPAVVSFGDFTIGDLVPEAVFVPSQPEIRDDGLAVIQVGIVLLGPGLTHETGGGRFGALSFGVVGELGTAGSRIVLDAVEVNISPDDADRDVYQPAPGSLSVQLVRVWPNPIFNVVVERGFGGAVVRWNTRLPGFDDVGRVRPAGSTADPVEVTSAVQQRYSEAHFAGLRLTRERMLDVHATPDPELVALFRAELELPGEGDDVLLRLVRAVRELDELLATRGHIVEFRNLEPATEYEFELRSTSLDDQLSQVHRGTFRTRTAPDLRPLFVEAFDVQVTPTGAAVSFGTNRPVTTAYELTRVSDNVQVALDTLNEDGQARTRFLLESLEAGVEYDLSIVASLVDATSLIENGLTEAETFRRLERRFRTPALSRPLRLHGPPVKIVGSDRANIVFEVNQPVEAIVDYGLVGDGETSGSLPVDLYDWSQESVGTLTRHNLTLSNLDPSTLFRYKITLVSAEGDTFSTDPRGNFQWSRDLRFRTAAAADTLPPAVIQGPVVDIRDVLAVVRFTTDVPTAATVYIGTDGGTYGTEDEFEFQDLTPDGEQRFANRHSVVVAGLSPGQGYRYRVEVESSNGKVTTVEPSVGSGKRLGVLQPPGGAGSFTTSNDPDTQFPVILSGPTVSSKTHETAVIEWTTDEPANSEVQFGVADVDEDSETSATSETAHQMTLSNLASGTSYSYLVGSTDASGNGATESSKAVFTTDAEVDLTAPQIVSAPSVVYKNDESATIQWTTDENATGEITFGTSQDDLSFIRTLPTTDQAHEVTLTNLEASTTYYYQAASSDLSNNGPTTSDVLSFTTDAAADVTAPTISDIAVSEGDSTVILTWTTDELADSFVDFGTVSGILDLTTGDAEDVTAHEVTLTNLTPGTTYYYTVGSIDRANNGPTLSAENSFTTLSSADVTPPASPSGLSGTAGSEQVILSWSANTELDLAGYNVYRRAAGADTFSAVITRVSGTSYTDVGLTNDTAYDYRITAIDRATPPNESEATTNLSLTPTLSAAPTTPTNLSVTGGDLLPTFSFANAEAYNTGATLTYTLQVSTASDFSDVTASTSGIAEGDGTTSWTIDRALTQNQTYYWRVRAVEGTLKGPFTDAQSFTASAAVAGDFDNSGAVDLTDFFMFADAYGKPAADYAAYDLDSSGADTTIDLTDFFMFADAYSAALGKPAAAVAFAHRLESTGRILVSMAGGPMGAADLPRDVVRVRLQAREMEALRAYGVVVRWDPAALTFTGATEGPGPLLERSGGRASLFRVLDQRPGRAVIANALVAGDAVGGAGLLAQLTFRLRDARLASGTAVEVEQAFVAAHAGDVRRVTGLSPSQLRPTDFALGQAYPNPFNPSTHIDFALAEESQVQLVVYDVLGRVVRTLVRSETPLAAGYYAVTWDGRDSGGRPVGNGVYFYRLQTPNFRATGKMLMLK